MATWTASWRTWHPEIEWHQAQGLPHGGYYRGLDEVRRNIFDPLRRGVVGGVLAPSRSEVVDAGDARGRARPLRRPGEGDGEAARRAVSRISGRFASGKAVRFRQFLDTAGLGRGAGDGLTWS